MARDDHLEIEIAALDRPALDPAKPSVRPSLIRVEPFTTAALALSRERRLNTPAIHPDAAAPLDGCSAC